MKTDCKEMLRPYFGKNCRLTTKKGEQLWIGYVFDAADEKTGVETLYSEMADDSPGATWEKLEKAGKHRGDLVPFAAIIYDSEDEPAEYDGGLEGVMESTPQMEGFLVYDPASGEVFHCDEGTISGVSHAPLLNELKIAVLPQGFHKNGGGGEDSGEDE